MKKKQGGMYFGLKYRCVSISQYVIVQLACIIRSSYILRNCWFCKTVDCENFACNCFNFQCVILLLFAIINTVLLFCWLSALDYHHYKCSVSAYFIIFQVQKKFGFSFGAYLFILFLFSGVTCILWGEFQFFFPHNFN